MSIISNYARVKKFSYFFQDVPVNAKILEIGCGDGWVKQKLYIKKLKDRWQGEIKVKYKNWPFSMGYFN